MPTAVDRLKKEDEEILIDLERKFQRGKKGTGMFSVFASGGEMAG